MTGTTHMTTALLEQLRAGDPNALNALISHAQERLRLHTRRMLKGYSGVKRREETDDVLQNALLRLSQALKSAGIPQSSNHFYNLAQLQIRRELLDLTDRYRGSPGVGANHLTDTTGGAMAGLADRAGEPSSLAEWGDFHRLVGELPEEQREVFGLIWYGGLKQEEVAALLSIHVRTVKRRWQEARLSLYASLGGGLTTS